MTKLRVKLNPKGLRQLLRSGPVLAELEARGRRVADAAGEGFEIEGEVGRNRARVTVFPDTAQAARAERDELALTRAIGAAR